MNQTVWPLAVPLYRGRRTCSFERSTWSALSRTRFFVGSRPESWPSPCAAPGVPFAALGGEDPPYQATPTTTTANARRIEASHLVLPCSVSARMAGPSVDIEANKDRRFASTH